MATRPHVRFLAEDIWDMPDDGNRYEVIDGDLFVTPPPVREHQHSSGELHYWINHYLHQHPIGVVYAAPIGVILDESGGVQPDLVYVSNEHREILTSRGVEGVPDLVVEILSPSTRARDLGVKLRRYAAAGVPHYWIVDPQALTLAAHELGADGYGPPSVYRSGDVFRPALFPGLEVAISTLWA